MRIPGYALALFVALAALPLRAEEVTIEHNGLTLNADLKMAAGKTMRDGVILFAHASLQHNRMEIVRVFTEQLRSAGFSTLAYTFSAGLDNRRGPYDCATPHRHTIEGRIKEVGLWVEWLKQQGVGEIVLAGHSGGANRTGEYIVESDDPIFKKVLLIAPGTGDDFARSPEGYRARYRTDLNVILKRARALMNTGKGDTFMEKTDIMFCARTTVSAKSFLSFYGPTKLQSHIIPWLMDRMPKPTLVVAASEDNIAPDLARMVEPFVDGKRLRLVVLEGCGHFFRDLCADDAVEAAVEFLKE